MPTVLEIAVLRMRAGDNPDAMARAVSDLRNGFAHHDDITVLPAPLAFMRKVEDYAGRHALAAEDDGQDVPEVADGEVETESGNPTSQVSTALGTDALGFDMDAILVDEDDEGDDGEDSDPGSNGDGSKDDGLDGDFDGWHGDEDRDGDRGSTPLGKDEEEEAMTDSAGTENRTGQSTDAGFSLAPVLDLPGFVNAAWVKGQGFEGMPEILANVTRWHDELEELTGFANWPAEIPSEEEGFALMVEGMRHPLFLRAFFRIGRRDPRTGQPRKSRYTIFKRLRARLEPGGRRTVKAREKGLTFSPMWALDKWLESDRKDDAAIQYAWVAPLIIGGCSYPDMTKFYEEHRQELGSGMTDRLIQVCREMRFAPFDWQKDVLDSSDEAFWPSRQRGTQRLEFGCWRLLGRYPLRGRKAERGG